MDKPGFNAKYFKPLASALRQGWRAGVTASCLLITACLALSPTSIHAQKNSADTVDVIELSAARYEEFGVYESYRDRLLELALKKTKEDYGDYTIDYIRYKNLARSIRYAKSGSRKNFIFGDSYRKDYEGELSFIPIPLELGIVGYRICFVSEDKHDAIAQVKNKHQLKAFSLGLRKSWHDFTILKHNGFQVYELHEYLNPRSKKIESTFFHKMVAFGRFDLYCRGIGEFKREWEEHKVVDQLSYNKTFALYYPLPRFFWTHKDNKSLIERVTVGLKRALKDGSFRKIWDEHFLDSVEFAQMENRRVFTLENPDLDGLDMEFTQYFVDPLDL